MIFIAKKEKLLKNDFSPHFTMAMLNKDLKYFSELANTLEKPSFIGSLMKQLFSVAFEKHKTKDFSAIYEVMKEM